MCVNYHLLNKLTMKNIYPLPHIQELLNRVRKLKVLLKIDLLSGY
jgi:putative transposase